MMLEHNGNMLLLYPSGPEDFSQYSQFDLSQYSLSSMGMEERRLVTRYCVSLAPWSVSAIHPHPQSVPFMLKMFTTHKLWVECRCIQK